MIPDDAAYIFQDFYIPARMFGEIRRYIDHGIAPGDFLTAVICNDLIEACGSADEENLKNLPAYVAYFESHAPGMCWQSWKRMEAWIWEHDVERRSLTR